MPISPYRDILVDEMPSRIWQRLIAHEAENIARKTRLKSVYPLLKLPTFKDVLDHFVEVINSTDDCK